MTTLGDSRRGDPASNLAGDTAGPAPVRARFLLAIAAVGLLAMPALAAPTISKTPAKQRFSFDTPLMSLQTPSTDLSKFGFTASGATGSTLRLQSIERGFRFTPSGQADNRKALSLGLTTRVVAANNDRSRAAAPAEALAALPTSVDFDLSVGWKGFAVNTGLRHVEPGSTALLANRRDAVDLGLSYRGANWKTSLTGTAEQAQRLNFAPLERRYSVELGGAYFVAPRLSVSGGLRYRLAPIAPSLLDTDRDDQAVYLGTKIAF
ncbi:MAG: hypothetical protein RL490_237 [Pseudomonadota bacterium]